MAVANIQAYYDTVTITSIKSFLVQGLTGASTFYQLAASSTKPQHFCPAQVASVRALYYCYYNRSTVACVRALYYFYCNRETVFTTLHFHCNLPIGPIS